MVGVLAERVVAITGAGRGLGREHALLAAAEGAAVVVNDLSDGDTGGPAGEVMAEIEAHGGRALAVEGDVSDAKLANELVATAVERFGALHGVVNNAGILRDRTLVNMTDEEWELCLRVNLSATFYATRAAAQHWRAVAKESDGAGRFAVVNTSSESGVFGNAGQSNYVAAKAGVVALTEVWHKELGRYGARVNCILPRARTRLTENPAIQPREGKFDRWHPAHVSPLVVHLLSESCDVSGQVFLAGGGLVQRAAPWSLDDGWVLNRDGAWSPAELDEAFAAMPTPSNEGRNTGMIRA